MKERGTGSRTRLREVVRGKGAIRSYLEAGLAISVDLNSKGHALIWSFLSWPGSIQPCQHSIKFTDAMILGKMALPPWRNEHP